MGEGVGLKAVRGLSTRATVNFNRTLCTSFLLQELLLSLFILDLDNDHQEVRSMI